MLSMAATVIERRVGGPAIDRCFYQLSAWPPHSDVMHICRQCESNERSRADTGVPCTRQSVLSSASYVGGI